MIPLDKSVEEYRHRKQLERRFRFKVLISSLYSQRSTPGGRTDFERLQSLKEIIVNWILLRAGLEKLDRALISKESPVRARGSRV
jgi:hypothetical protein